MRCVQTEGLYVEVLFLDYVLLYAHGLVLFLCFGTEPTLYDALLSLLGRISRY